MQCFTMDKRGITDANRTIPYIVPLPPCHVIALTAPPQIPTPPPGGVKRSSSPSKRSSSGGQPPSALLQEGLRRVKEGLEKI